MFYFNNTLLGFTTNTSYTVNNPSNPYGTYKVVATFQKYDGLNSQPATYELKKQSANLRIIASTINVPTFNISDITKYVTVYNGSTDVTSETSNWTLSSISGPVTSTSVSTLTEAGTYTLRYRFTYDGETKETGSITVTVTGTNTGSGGEEPTTPDGT